MIAEIKIEHRNRILVDVIMECGCILTYEFEFEPAPQPSHVTGIFVNGGWWVPTLWHPGEITDNCKGSSNCSTLNRSITDLKKEMFEKAVKYIGDVVGHP